MACPDAAQPPVRRGAPPVRDLAAVLRRGGRVAARAARSLVVALTRPLPNHVAHYREPARSALVIATLGIVGLTYPLAADVFDRTLLLVLAGIGAAFGTASFIPRLHPLLARADGLLGVTLVAGLVTASGGPPRYTVRSWCCCCSTRRCSTTPPA